MTPSSRHLVDPELAPLLDLSPATVLNHETLPLIRAELARMPKPPAESLPQFPDIEVTEQRVPGFADGPEVRVLIYKPLSLAAPHAALLWIHGGGYVLGSADSDDLRAKRFASEGGCTVVSVDYRLAPDTPHPGPVEDCYAALKWLHQHAAEWGVDPDQIAIGGASAGGGLAAALGLLTRDRGEIPLIFELLIYPMLDDRTAVAEDPHPYTGEFMWTHHANHFGWSALLGQPPGGPDVSPYAAAARADDLAGLPPTYISVGALDLFLEENVAYAQRLIRAGVSTELHVYPGAYHGFNMVPTAQVTLAAERDVINALRRALHPQKPAPAARSGVVP